MPIDLVGAIEHAPHAARIVVGTVALELFSEWAWRSYRQIPKRVWFLIPWVGLGILSFIAAT